MKTYKSFIDRIKLVKEPSEVQKVRIKQSAEAVEYFKNFYADDLEIYESMFLLLLNRRNNTIGIVKISQGGTAGTVTDLKLIAKYALEGLANSIILCHNHPSGETSPSEADILITKKVKDAMSLFEIKLLDHVIICNDSHYSFADEGKL